MRIPLLAIFIAAVSSSAPAVPQAFPVPDRRVRLETAFGDIDRQFTDFMKTAHVPGAAWGVIIDGELAHSGAAGPDCRVQWAGRCRHRLSHRVDDQELHRDGDPQASRRRSF